MNAALNQLTERTRINLEATRDMPRLLEVQLHAGYVDAAALISFRRKGRVTFKAVSYSSARHDQCSVMTVDGRQTLMIGDNGHFPLADGEAALILAQIPLREWGA